MRMPDSCRTKMVFDSDPQFSIRRRGAHRTLWLDQLKQSGRSGVYMGGRMEERERERERETLYVICYNLIRYMCYRVFKLQIPDKNRLKACFFKEKTKTIDHKIEIVNSKYLPNY